MTRRVAACALATLALLASAAPAAGQGTGPIGADALWAWSWDSPEELAGFAADAGFARVHLYSQGGFDAKVRSAIAALSARGIAVEALGGEKRWATTQRRDMLRFVRSAVRYQRSAPPGLRLAGIHVDIEPYDLASWERDQRAVAESLAAALRDARRAAGPLPLSADIPAWFDGIRMRGGESLAELAMRSTDATTIMAYRDSAAEVIDAARREVRIATELGRPTTLAVETAAVRPRAVTFFEEGRTALIRALARIRAEFGRRSGFAGIAVHHYGSLRGLPNG